MVGNTVGMAGASKDMHVVETPSSQLVLEILWEQQFGLLLYDL